MNGHPQEPGHFVRASGYVEQVQACSWALYLQ